MSVTVEIRTVNMLDGSLEHVLRYNSITKGWDCIRPATNDRLHPNTKLDGYILLPATPPKRLTSVLEREERKSKHGRQ